MKNKILIGVISIINFIVGFTFYQDCQDFFISFLPEINFQYLKISTIMYQSLFFAIVLALFPLFISILIKKYNIKNVKSKILIIIAFVLFSFIAILIKNSQLRYISESPFSSKIISNENGNLINKPLINAESLNYSLFIFIAQILTFITLFFVYKKQKKYDYS